MFEIIKAIVIEALEEIELKTRKSEIIGRMK